MNTFEAHEIVRSIVNDHHREAQQRSLARQFQESEQVAPTPRPVEAPRRHSLLWSLVHLRHALG